MVQCNMYASPPSLTTLQQQQRRVCRVGLTGSSTSRAPSSNINKNAKASPELGHLHSLSGACPALSILLPPVDF